MLVHCRVVPLRATAALTMSARESIPAFARRVNECSKGRTFGRGRARQSQVSQVSQLSQGEPPSYFLLCSSLVMNEHSFITRRPAASDWSLLDEGSRSGRSGRTGVGARPPALSAGSRRYKCSVLPGAPLQAGLPTQPSAADPARQVVGGARRLWQPIAAHAAQHGFNRRWQINLIANRDKQRVGVWPCAHHHPNRLALVQQR